MNVDAKGSSIEVHILAQKKKKFTKQIANQRERLNIEMLNLICISSKSQDLRWENRKKQTLGTF